MKKFKKVFLTFFLIFLCGGVLLASSFTLKAFTETQSNFEVLENEYYYSFAMMNPKFEGSIELIKDNYLEVYRNRLLIDKYSINGVEKWDIFLEYTIYDEFGGLVQKSYSHDITQLMKVSYNQDNDLYNYKFNNIFITLTDGIQDTEIIIDFVNIILIDNAPSYDNISSITLNSTFMNNDFRYSQFSNIWRGLVPNQTLYYNSLYMMAFKSDSTSGSIMENGLISKWVDYLSPAVYSNYATGYSRGYQYGFFKGEQNALNGDTGLGYFWGIIANIFDGVGRVFKIEVVPHINLGTILLVPVVIGLVGFILWIWRKN